MRTRTNTETTAPAASTVRHSTLRRWLTRSTIATSVVATFVVGGAAIAAWNVQGEGIGTADAAGSDPLSATVSIAEMLYPGHTTDVVLLVDNPNPFPVELQSVTFDVEVEGGPFCTTLAEADVTFVPLAAGEFVIPQNATGHEVVLTDAVSMGDAPNDCQNATFDIEVTLLGESTINP